jgi:putative CocE/NonD family hydrolase
MINIVIIILLLPLYASGQSIAGDWYSILEIENMELSFNLHVTETDGGYTATFDVPDQGAVGVPLSSFTVDDGEVEFEFAPANFSFSGLASDDFTRLKGFFKQGDFNGTQKFIRDQSKLPETIMEKIKRLYSKEEVYIEMRDGVKLFTSIYSPRNPSGKSPILMFRTPYNAEPLGEEAYNFFLTAYERFIREEYIMVFQDVRGRYMSEGTFENVRPLIPKKRGTMTDEASDTYDTADWLVKNVENNNGNIGVTGISYPGFYATMAIRSEHPAIKAVSPQAPVTDWFMGDDWHHNGAFFLMDAFNFMSFFGDPHPGESRRGYPLNINYGMEDSYQYFMEMGPIKNSFDVIPDSVYYWYEIFDHPNYDRWWKARVPLQYLDKVSPAVMTVGGWFDAEDLYGALQTYKAIEEKNRKKLPNHLVMGPWSHGQWAMGDADHLGNIYWGMPTNEMYHQLELDFFNYYLKDKGKEDFAEAYIYMTGANEWKEYEKWPPKNAEEQTIYFAPEGELSMALPDVDNYFVEYTADPSKPVPYMEDVHLRRETGYMVDDQRFAARRPDVVVFETDVLEEDLVLTGPVSANLYVTTTGTDADFVVKIIDVFPNQVRKPDNTDIDVPLGGYQMLVRGEIMRGKYRNSFEAPEPFTPGQTARVQFDIPDLAHTFKKGHRLMVQVQSSWFPLVDRNPQKFVNIYTCDEEDFQKADIRIYADREHPSGIKVMIQK